MIVSPAYRQSRRLADRPIDHPTDESPQRPAAQPASQSLATPRHGRRPWLYEPLDKDRREIQFRSPALSMGTFLEPVPRTAMKTLWWPSQTRVREKHLRRCRLCSAARTREPETIPRSAMAIDCEYAAESTLAARLDCDARRTSDGHQCLALPATVMPLQRRR